MARTRQNARVSTGGKAPRRSLGRVRKYYIYGRGSSQQQADPESPEAASGAASPHEEEEEEEEEAEKRDDIAVTAVISRQEAASRAQREVLSCPDILVIILSQLPHSSLLKAQRVNRTWASLFDHVEIQAALFRRPRPSGAALYAETYSDILMDRFSAAFWPATRYDPAEFAHTTLVHGFHSQIPDAASESDGESEDDDAKTDPELGPCPYRHQWAQLLVCQPPIKALDIVQDICRRGAESVEFRTVMPRPDGLRMGFLYDAVRYWHEVDRSRAVMRWHRRTGEYAGNYYYTDDPDFVPGQDGTPCVTICGRNSEGCGWYGGQTYRDEASGQGGRLRAIESGEENVEFRMSRARPITHYLSDRTARRLMDGYEESDEESSK